MTGRAQKKIVDQDIVDTLKASKSLIGIKQNTMLMGTLIALPWLFLFSLPFLHFGIWMDVEAIAFSLAMMGGIGSFVLCLNIMKTKTFIISPLSLMFAGIACLSIVLLPLSPLPSLSWFGHPEGGMSAWTFLSFFIFTTLYHQAQDKFAITLSLIAASMALGLFTLICHPYYFGSKGTSFVIYHFTAYLVWPAIGLLLITPTFPQKWQHLTLLAFSVCLILLSQSKTAYGILLLSPLLLLPTVTRKRVIQFSLALPFIMLLSLWISYKGGFSESLTSRYTSIEVIFQDFLHAPWWRMFTGFGFGEMSDAIIRNTTFINHAAQGGWEGFGRFDSSSINQIIDMIAALGLLGGMLYTVFLMSPLLFSKNKPVFATSLAVILALAMASYWFMMLPVIAIALIGYLHHDKKIMCLPLTKPVCMGAIVLFSILGTSLFYTSHILYSTGVFYSYDFKGHSLPVKFALPEKESTPENLLHYKGPGGIHLAFWLRHYVWSRDTRMDDTIQTIIQKLEGVPVSLTLAHSINLFKEKTP